MPDLYRKIGRCRCGSRPLLGCYEPSIDGIDHRCRSCPKKAGCLRRQNYLESFNINPTDKEQRCEICQEHFIV